MKISTFIAITILLLQSVTRACPSLNGAFLCRVNSYREETIYSFDQSQSDNFWTYTITANLVGKSPASSYQVVADGEERDIFDKITGRKLKLRAVCDQDFLQVDGQAAIGQGNVIHFSEKLRLDGNRNLFNESIDINGQVVQEVCVRN